MVPAVSVVIRTHNRSELLFEAIQCVLAQTYRPIEILVIDHNSTDNTEAVVESFGSSVRYIKHEGSFHDTFNVWRNIVKGEFVSFLDDDDYIAPNCIEVLANILISQNDIDVVFFRHRIFSVQPEKCCILYDTAWLAPDRIKEKLLLSNVIPWNAVVIRKKCLSAIPWIEGGTVGAFDWFFWVYAAVAGCRFHQLDRILGMIRKSSDSVQYEIERMSSGGLNCIRYYGNNLCFKEKLAFGFAYSYGYRLIRHGLILLESTDHGKGRLLLLKGLCIFFFSFRKRRDLVAGLLILMVSLTSDKRKARSRIEKISRRYLFRNYFEKQSIQNCSRSCLS